jgi:hypothetical protein
MAESQPWRTWAKNFAICAAAGVFLALAGAMQTGELPLLIRLAYWVPLMMGGAIVGRALSAAVVLIPRATVSRWVFGFLLAVAISVPITGVVWIYTNTLFGAGMRLAELPQLFGSVLVISAAMTAIMIAVNWPGRITHSAPAAGGQRQVRFLERLPPKLRGAELYAVSAEDHYLRLHTSKGSDLILMRLSDAINELEGLEGAQTHRSWWVARNSIEGSRRDGDRVILLLKGGVEAPVSRPNVRPLRDNGWL